VNTKDAAAYIGSSESYLDKTAVARQRAQKKAESEGAQEKAELEGAQEKAESEAAELAKIGPAFRWIGHRREYDRPHLDDFIRATTVEPRRSSTAIQPSSEI
jgi:hypothetical protein